MVPGPETRKELNAACCRIALSKSISRAASTAPLARRAPGSAFEGPPGARRATPLSPRRSRQLIRHAGRCGTLPSPLAPDCLVRGHRVNGAPRRSRPMRSATPTLDPAATPTEFGACTGDGQNQVLLCPWHRHGVLAGLTAGSSSSDLRMIFIPSPHICRLLREEALTAACGLPLNLTALVRRTGRSEGVTKPPKWKCYLGLHDYVQDRPDRPHGGPPPRRQTCRRCGKKRDQDALPRGAPWVGGP
jgi:hypothetical protein